MSKKALERAIKRNRVQAVLSKFTYKEEDGKAVKIPLYDIYGPEYLRR